jgi:hypothetical protein
LITIVLGEFEAVTEFANVVIGVLNISASLLFTLKNNPLLGVQLLIAAAGSKLKVSNEISPSSQLLKIKMQISKVIIFFMILYLTQKYNFICRYSVV